MWCNVQYLPRPSSLEQHYANTRFHCWSTSDNINVVIFVSSRNNWVPRNNDHYSATIFLVKLKTSRGWKHTCTWGGGGLLLLSWVSKLGTPLAKLPCYPLANLRFHPPPLAGVPCDSMDETLALRSQIVEWPWLSTVTVVCGSVILVTTILAGDAVIWHSFDVGRRWTTTMQLTRSFQPNRLLLRNLVDPWLNWFSRHDKSWATLGSATKQVQLDGTQQSLNVLVERQKAWKSFQPRPWHLTVFSAVGPHIVLV